MALMVSIPIALILAAYLWYRWDTRPRNGAPKGSPR